MFWVMYYVGLFFERRVVFTLYCELETGEKRGAYFLSQWIKHGLLHFPAGDVRCQ
jgi:hypothetical protein